jgi:hypothetical protein
MAFYKHAPTPYVGVSNTKKISVSTEVALTFKAGSAGVLALAPTRCAKCSLERQVHVWQVDT